MALSRLRTQVLTVLAATLLAACGVEKEDARIDVLVVESGAGLGQRLERLELTVSPVLPGSSNAIQREEEPAYGAQGLRPWVVPVHPLDPDHVGRVLYRFRVIGYAGDREVIRRQHRVVFVQGTRLTLLMRLDASCVGLPCGAEADRTCVDGRCVDDYVPGCTVFAGDIPAICTMPMDASVDAGRDSGPPPDVGVDAHPDSGPDAGPDAGARCGDAGPCSVTATCCGDRCVDTASDPTSCGGCGMACSDRQECRAGTCQCELGYADCDTGQPGCETELATNPAHCGACGTRCEGDTPACLGGTCGTCVSDADCPAGPPGCTDPTRCVDGRCEQSVLPGFCVIAGRCQGMGAVVERGSCFGCLPAVDPFEWSPLPAGAACELDRCTVESTCDGGGGCRGGTARDCNDGVPCTVDVCDPELSVGCEHRTDGRSCDFAGSCYAEGQWHPAGTCLVCTMGTWLARAAGTPCDDGLYCTVGDVCTADRCAGAARTCPPDALECTTEVCNETDDRCDPAPLPGRCLIDGACYFGGQWNAAAVCREICDTSRSTTSFTVTTGEGYNCGPDRICTAGACTPCAAGLHDCTGAIGGCECAEPSTCMGATCVEPPDAGPVDAGVVDAGDPDGG